MKVRLILPQPGIQAGVRAVGPDGKEVEVSYLEIEPFFYRRNERSPIAFFEMKHGNRTFSRATLAISGVSGQLALQQQRKPVKSQFELEMEGAYSKKARKDADSPKPDEPLEIPLPPQ